MNELRVIGKVSLREISLSASVNLKSIYMHRHVRGCARMSGSVGRGGGGAREGGGGGGRGEEEGRRGEGNASKLISRSTCVP